MRSVIYLCGWLLCAACKSCRCANCCPVTLPSTPPRTPTRAPKTHKARKSAPVNAQERPARRRRDSFSTRSVEFSKSYIAKPKESA